MNITEAIQAVSAEYDKECLQAREDPAFHRFMAECIGREYDQIDPELPGYVAEIAHASGVAGGTILAPYIYQMARMCFRLGMRVQRKLDDPEEPSSISWWSEGRPSKPTLEGWIREMEYQEEDDEDEET